MRRSVHSVSFEVNLRIILTGMFLSLLVIVFRLYNLQIAKGEEFREISTNNRVRKIVLAAPRGKIYDRNGKVLADTRPSYDLTIFLEDIEETEPLAKALSSIVNLEEVKINLILKKAIADRTRLPYIPYTLKKDLSIKEIVQIEEINFDLPGVSITPVPIQRPAHIRLIQP